MNQGNRWLITGLNGTLAPHFATSFRACGFEVIGWNRAWIPACSFMSDTADACMNLIRNRKSGLFHLDSNAGDGWSFDRVVEALKKYLPRENWVIAANESYRHDQRLAGGEDLIPSLSQRLRRTASDDLPLPRECETIA